MKDYCLELVAAQRSHAAKYNTMREYLQAYALKILYEHTVFETTAFVGETALRFLYGLPRFSEDLDFSLHKKPRYSFLNLMRVIQQEFILAGYAVNVSYEDEKIVQSAFIKFTGLLHEAGLSPLPGQKFSIKVEIDTRPPKGAVLTTHVVNKFFPIAFLSYDLPSLFAGKIHAFLTRKYTASDATGSARGLMQYLPVVMPRASGDPKGRPLTKGRDFFDIAWYLSRFKSIAPNMTLLRNALNQTRFKGTMPTEKNWRPYLRDAVHQADWKLVYKDVVNFLENPKEMDVFTKKNVLQLIGAPRE